MTRTTAIITVVKAVAAVATALAAFQLFFMSLCRPLGPMPSPVYAPFDSWSNGWILPPLPSGEYQIEVQYERKEGGRLGEALKIRLLDETIDNAVAIEGGPTFWEHVTIVGKCLLSDGHQYRVEVDPEQANELGLHHHRLRIGLSGDELRWRSPLP